MKTVIQILFIYMIFFSAAYSQAPADFAIISPNSSLQWQGASQHTILWNVANTANDVPYVDILLSTDGGVTYTEPLALKVPNDGSEMVIIPDIAGVANKIKVRKYNDDSFSDASDNDFIITAAGADFTLNYTDERTIMFCQDDVSFDIEYQALNGFSNETVISIATNSQFTASFNSTIQESGIVHIELSGFAMYGPSMYPVTIMAMSGNIVKTIKLYICLKYHNIYINNQTQSFTQGIAPTKFPFVWYIDIAYYTGQVFGTEPIDVTLEIASDMNFENILESATLSSLPPNPQISGIYMDYVSYLPEMSFVVDETYYWRLRFTDGCSVTYPTHTFVASSTECNSYASSDIPVEIPAAYPATVTSTAYFPVPSYTPAIYQLFSVDVNIAHPNIEELRVKVVSPQGDVWVLYNGCGGGENIDAQFNYSGADIDCSSNNGISGDVRLSFQTLYNLPQGFWTLEVEDLVGGNGGFINSWSLNFCTTLLPGSLSTPENTSPDKFEVFPNPNNGSFTVSFNSLTNNDIHVCVYDLAGRQVYSNDFKNTGAFLTDINLNNVQNGVYLVTVQDGNRSETRKVVVK
ncbi:T9SS type A sorting domain-containing protein [Flavobacterium sp. RHBU_3]|uniref:T9SS type A sorting domain-containing protein n=1 Tax=Flavobacterium sp. RHBU_3 TaxID=3391184 RepID=UPI003984F897